MSAADIFAVLIVTVPLVIFQFIPLAADSAVASVIVKAASNAPLVVVPFPPARVIPAGELLACPAMLMPVALTTPLLVKAPPSATLN